MAMIPQLCGQIEEIRRPNPFVVEVVLKDASRTYGDNRAILTPQVVVIDLRWTSGEDLGLKVGDRVSFLANKLGEDLWEAEGHTVLEREVPREEAQGS